MDKVILPTDIDVCSIGPYIKTLKAWPASNRTVPTEEWAVEFNDNVYLAEGVKAPLGHLKIWINPQTIRDVYPQTPEAMGKLWSLTYERMTYVDVIAPLTSNDVCPNFATYYGSGKSCSYQQLGNILRHGLKYSDEMINQILLRSVYYMLENYKDRPAIDDPRVGEFIIDYVWQNIEVEKLQFDITLTMYHKESVSFSKWFDKSRRDKKNYPEMMTGLFQAMAACYTMQLSRMNNYSMNPRVVELVQLDKPAEVTYIYGGRNYTFTTQVKVKVSDFTRSYVERAPVDNPVLNDLCQEVGLCNRFIPNLDALMFFCNIYMGTSEEIKRFIERIIIPSDDPRVVSHLMKLFLENVCYPEFVEDIPKPTEFYRQFSSVERMMEVIASGMTYDSDRLASNPDSVFVCDPEMFDEIGNLVYRQR